MMSLRMTLIIFLMYNIAGPRIKKCHDFIDQNCFVFVMIRHYTDSTMFVVSFSHEWDVEQNHSRNIQYDLTRDVSHVSFGTCIGL